MGISLSGAEFKQIKFKKSAKIAWFWVRATKIHLLLSWLQPKFICFHFRPKIQRILVLNLKSFNLSRKIFQRLAVSSGLCFQCSLSWLQLLLGVGPHFAYLNCEAKKSFEFDSFENLQKKLRMWRFSTEGMKEALDGNFGWKLYDWYFFMNTERKIQVKSFNDSAQF